MKLNTKKISDGFLGMVEKGGNALPHPAALFALFALGTLLVSGIASWLGWQGINPATGETIIAVNLLSVEARRWLPESILNEYTHDNYVLYEDL